MPAEMLSADDIRDLLGLKPHPTCGFVSEIFRSPMQIPVAELPAVYGKDGSRALGSVLHFLVTPETRLRLHRIRADQMYHHYLGDPLEVLLLYADGRGEVASVGADLRAGMRPQLFIPGGTFHVGRLRPGGRYALLSTSEWPGVDPEDVELGDVEKLVGAFPEMREQIRAFTAAGPSGTKAA